jgi:hypothetical protein
MGIRTSDLCLRRAKLSWRSQILIWKQVVVSPMATTIWLVEVAVRQAIGGDLLKNQVLATSLSVVRPQGGEISDARAPLIIEEPIYH